MNKTEILDFICNNPTSHMATVDGGKPRVRALGIYRADENGIVIQVSEVKDVHRQLINNPETELCFNNPKEGIQVRVSGRLELLEDAELKKEVVAKRPFLKPLVDKNGLDVIKIWVLKNGQANVWTMKANFEPREYIQL